MNFSAIMKNVEICLGLQDLRQGGKVQKIRRNTVKIRKNTVTIRNVSFHLDTLSVKMNLREKARFWFKLD